MRADDVETKVFHGNLLLIVLLVVVHSTYTGVLLFEIRYHDAGDEQRGMITHSYQVS